MYNSMCQRVTCKWFSFVYNFFCTGIYMTILKCIINYCWQWIKYSTCNLADKYILLLILFIWSCSTCTYKITGWLKQEEWPKIRFTFNFLLWYNKFSFHLNDWSTSHLLLKKIKNKPFICHISELTELKRYKLTISK